jgi:hypothetical protein
MTLLEYLFTPGVPVEYCMIFQSVNNAIFYGMIQSTGALSTMYIQEL